jgi:hypothetical protein
MRSRGCQHFIAVTSIIIEEWHKNCSPEKVFAQGWLNRVAGIFGTGGFDVGFEVLR